MAGSDELGEDEASVMAAEPRRRRRGAQAPLDEAALREAGLAYVARYSASATMLRRVLSRKLQRAAAQAERDPEHVIDADVDPEGAAETNRAMVEKTVTALAAMGAVDDAAFAQGRAASLFRRGAGPRAIQASLSQRGVDAATIEAALDDLREDAPDEDLALLAAIRLARRRRLGPWRADPTVRADKRAGDLAALARSGAPFDAARRVVDGDLDELEALLRAPAAP